MKVTELENGLKLQIVNDSDKYIVVDRLNLSKTKEFDTEEDKTNWLISCKCSSMVSEPEKHLIVASSIVIRPNSTQIVERWPQSIVNQIKKLNMSGCIGASDVYETVIKFFVERGIDITAVRF